MFAFVCRQQIALTTERGLVTRRTKASQMLQSIVCAFRSIAGAATARPCNNNLSTFLAGKYI